MGRLVHSAAVHKAHAIACSRDNGILQLILQLRHSTTEQTARTSAGGPIMPRERRRTLSSRASVPHPDTASSAVQLPTVFNTVSGALDTLPDPCAAGPLKWYSCGPTVYDSAHLGHARTYVSLDVIRRLLVDYFHLDVTYALGITDVDDKIIARGAAKGLKRWDEIAVMARQFEGAFMKDMDDLGVRRPDAVTRVTEHIPDIIAYIERILENGMAYEADGGIYFDVERMGTEYGKLGVGHQAEGVEEADLRGKRSHKDFALWKRAKPGEPWWESPFGNGRPGWHIECSAMTHSLFGPKLDLHSGGIDLKFPHHTNEIAQCEAHCCGPDLSAIRTGGTGRVNVNPGRPQQQQPWVKHWLHTGHLHIEGLKMSKSLKNFITVRDYLDGHMGGREAASQDFRMFCLMHKYSSSVTFSEDRMEEARVLRGRLERFLALADSALDVAGHKSAVQGPCRWGEKEKRLVEEISSCRRGVHLSLCDDFDTPKAVRHLAALSSLFSTHLSSGGDIGNVGPLRSAAKYTADTLTLLGLRSGRCGRGSEGVSEGMGVAAPGGGLAPAREFADAMVELRRAMRQAALQHKLEDANQMKRKLLKLADHSRDVTLKNLGVQVDDQSDYKCKWITLSPSTSSSHPSPTETGTGTSDGKAGGI